MPDTWRELSDDNIAAARVLLQNGNYRSCVSRAYYAAYCAATFEILQKTRTFGNRNNPSHENVTALISGVLTIPSTTKRAVNRRFRVLLAMRIDADYRPSEAIDRRSAYIALNEADGVRKLFDLKE